MSRRRIVLLFFLLLAAPLQAQQPATAPSVQADAEEIEIEPPVPLPEAMPRWPIAAGAALLGGGLLFVYLRKRKRKPQPAPLPHETALLGLAQADGLIAAHDCAAFAALFDQTLRHYLAERFGIAAQQQTASELIQRVTDENAAELLQEYSDTLRAWLALCEAAKFAEAALNEADMREMTSQLRAFVETTRAEAAKK
ncbi:LPXTG cell wall anchor domain-containing protein [Candidatus Electronema sp. JM]|uniref:LPXTG cell wall anchor domain-containing protein n=1 Tax=Candidatus Electronema sp. JM TaxID=3401571 RepID=UPI003AA89D21